MINSGLISEGSVSGILYYVFYSYDIIDYEDYYNILNMNVKGFLKASQSVCDNQETLVYDTIGYRSLKDMVSYLNTEDLILILKNMVDSISNICSYRFVKYGNIALSFKRIFVRTDTSSVRFVYLPVVDEETNESFEQFLYHFKEKLLSAMELVNGFPSEISTEIYENLMNSSYNLDDIKNCLINYQTNKRKVNSLFHIASNDKKRLALSNYLRCL